MIRKYILNHDIRGAGVIKESSNITLFRGIYKGPRILSHMRIDFVLFVLGRHYAPVETIH